jgi:Protein of unknown function (DUF1579)
MKTNLAPIALALAMLSVPTRGAEAPKKQAPLPSPDAMLAAYDAASKPVAAHKRLLELTGNWKMEVRLWFDPSQPPQVYPGTATGKMILGGRFLRMSAMSKGKLPVESLGIWGFDTRTSEYTMTGYDTMSTYSISAAGKYDPARKAIVLEGSFLQPPENLPQKYRFLLTSSKSNERLLTLLFLMPNGKELKVAETCYTR